MSKAHPHSRTKKDARFFGRVLDALVPSRLEKRVLAGKKDRLESFLRAIPLEYCGWDGARTQAVSPGFYTLLGLEKAESLFDIQVALLPGDAATLGALFERLVKYGEAFELIVQTLSPPRSLKLFGKRGLSGESPDASSVLFSVIWALDVSSFAEGAAKHAEASERSGKREDEIKSALNALPFPVWTRGSALDLSWCNKFYTRIVDDTGASVVAEQKELPLTGASKGDSSQRILAQRAMAKLSAQSMRSHIIVEGERRLIEIIEIPLPSEQRVIGVAIDVTKEEELATSYKRLAASQREVLEQLRTAIAMFDQDTRLEFYNSAYEELTGMSGVWLDARPRMVDIIDRMRELRKLPEQADYKQFKQSWISRFTSLLEPHEEMQYLPDGTVIRMIVVPRPMGGLLLTLEDVTSRLKLETSYNTLMAVQQETMDNLAEGIAVFGEDGKLKLSNQSYASLWNISSTEAAPHIAKLIERARPFFEAQEWDAAKQVILANALEREPRKGRMYRGNTVLEYSVVPLPDGNILNAWFDVTDTVKVEQALVEKNNALEEAERLKTDFLANVSYQLRTPLNAIMGFAEMLNQQYFGKLNERQLEYTKHMIEAGQRLISLVNDILDLSTIEAGYLKLYLTDVHLKDLIVQVTQLTREWARKQKLETVVDCTEADMTVFGDERRIKQVLLNLISNAINYSPGGGTIVISAKKEGDFAIISVQDTGLGIPDEELNRIFMPFEKINSRKTQRRSGAGLGLALVKSIVELHGGDVSIKSREGSGTRVTFTLPLRKMEDATPPL
jgi:signal transduction histidine kinase